MLELLGICCVLMLNLVHFEEEQGARSEDLGDAGLRNTEFQGSSACPTSLTWNHLGGWALGPQATYEFHSVEPRIAETIHKTPRTRGVHMG